MILRHGHVVAEGWWSPYRPSLRHKLYSLSKSFTSTAVGLAIGDGLLKLDTLVASLFPNEVPELSPKLAAMQVKHLLTMTTGHAKDTLTVMRESKDTWIKTFLSIPLDHEPGTFFLYNTGATYMLSAIVQRLTNQSLHDYLRARLFQPLGIIGEDWKKVRKASQSVGMA